MKILLKMAFDGTNYHGFQIQENSITVFEVFQKALIKILGHETDIKGCSRTDSGVHAKSYYVSFETYKDLNLGKLPLSLNANLPNDIRVLEATQVNDDFHARYHTKSKEYTYYIHNSHIDDLFNDRYYYKVPYHLDENLMNQAASCFVGTHDFKSFMAQKSQIVECTRTVHSAKVERIGDMITFKVSADGYLYNMVRIMVGTLIKAGAKQIAPEEIINIIKAKDRNFAGVTVPAKGLFLTNVEY